MALVRYEPRSPWTGLDLLSSRINRLFEDSFPTLTSQDAWVPAVNVEETADELILTAEVPGMTEDQVEVEIENNILTIRGEKREEREEGDENRRYHVWERRFGTFQRSFTLPRTVRADEVSAEFHNGVLTVHMPKVAEAKSRRIKIKKA
ncbi:MAG: Hsp20/alpha crystallin family protein [Gemmatimonadetes bacterium]|nr:MAG: Hsp20/alpha crystallin family protein [Gemmatimonadota bacterium]